MAQKKKPAKGLSRTSKLSGKKIGKTSTVKSASNQGRPSPKAAAKSATKAVAKVQTKKDAKVPASPSPASKVSQAPAAKAEKQIQQAKAALKRENVQAAAPASAAKPEAKPRARKISIDVSPNEAASALAQKWSILYKKAEQIESKPYNMKAVFEEKTAITHKVLGWGYILANRNDRLEVLFKDGIKYLISNYKP